MSERDALIEFLARLAIDPDLMRAYLDDKVGTLREFGFDAKVIALLEDPQLDEILKFLALTSGNGGPSPLPLTH
jgi:hypothetical protein